MTHTQIYKTVSADGRSIHGGDLQWSLPQGDQPGDWHEVDGEIEKCVRGIHLTDDPARWWKPGCRVYVAEAEGVVGSCEDDADRKIVCRRARLLREATRAELDSLRIWGEGHHEVKAGEVAIVSGSASVVAWGSARVEAWDSARVEAWDSARVEASGSASVVARGSASVVAWGSARVEAWDSASVVARGSVTIVTWRRSTAVKIMDRAVWIERGDGEGTPIMHVATEAS